MRGCWIFVLTKESDMSLILNGNNELIFELPHDWTKFKEYLINQGLGGYLGETQDRFDRIEARAARSLAWILTPSFLNQEDLSYRLKGDEHWLNRLFYVENKEAFESGKYVLEFLRSGCEWEKWVNTKSYPDFVKSFKYRITRVVKTPTQQQLFYEALAKEGRRDELFMDMLRNGDMTQSDLLKLIERRPEVYGKYKGYLKPNTYKVIALLADSVAAMSLRSFNQLTNEQVSQKAYDAFLNSSLAQPDMIITEDNPLFERIALSEWEWKEGFVVDVDPLT
jgi:hypothetical protein